jgi:DNA-binding MarR family transcriptional regulator
MPSNTKSKRIKKTSAPPSASAWTFLTNHAHVLISLASDPELRLREVATTVGITERAVQKIIAELEAGGVISRERDGRRNRYEIHSEVPLRHPVEAHRKVGHILSAILKGK